ncbi:Sterile alpha motif domain - like 6 [Theobroma cacao]|nr:Sterile alpha motif domain - like 6 [Theobroma cacao]
MEKPRVTITLGDSGKVVKMRDNVMVDRGRMSGSKRFIKNRPRSYGGAENYIYSNKRHRGDGSEWRSGGSRLKGSCLAGNDLRLKLIRKSRPHHFRSVLEDRRKRNSEKLSKDTRPPQNLSMRPCRPGPNGIDNLNRITTNCVRDGLHIYPLQTMDGSRGFAEMPQIIPTAPARADLFSSNGVFDSSRVTGIIPLTEKDVTASRVTYVAPMSSLLQRRQHVDNEPFTVTALLDSLGLGKYAILFRAEEVDMTALRQMGDRDLKELGIPMGPRKKLLAFMPPSRRHLPHM